MTYQKVEGRYHSIKAQNQRRGNNKPVLLYERNLDTLMAMYDYAASQNDCRVEFKDNVIRTKGDYNTVLFSITTTYEFIQNYSKLFK